MSQPVQIGKYSIIKELGRGATAVVYLGHDPFTRRHVAIKAVLGRHLRDPISRNRVRRQFLREASLAGQLDHPHIVHVFDAVANDDEIYLVMEYVGGGTLKQYCTLANLLSVSEVLQIIYKCSQALAYAHRHGIIHRDIKPSNIMVTGNREIKIADFGTAMLALSEETRTRGPQGSPAYMAPEQIREDPLNFQTDMYALGVSLYEMLAGRLPFLAENDFSMAYKILNELPTRLRLLRPEVPEDLEDLVLRAMAKNPAHRYASWEEFTRAVLAQISGLHEQPVAITDAEKFELLRQLKFFKPFGENELWETLHLCYWRTFAAGRVFLKEGNLGHGFFVLVTGEVEVHRRGQHIARLGPGEVFGEMSYIDPSLPRTATVVAATEVQIIKIKAASLHNASDACQTAFSKAFLSTLVHRLLSTQNMLVTLLREPPN